MTKIIYYHDRTRIRRLPENHILLFSSNTRGAHGAGLAKDAHSFFGAKYGQSFGFQGQCYAVPTRIYHTRKVNNSMFENMTLKAIGQHVKLFFEDAKKNPHLVFVITRIGCGLAGYTDEDIAPFFTNPLSNMVLPMEWINLIDHDQAIHVII